MPVPLRSPERVQAACGTSPRRCWRRCWRRCSLGWCPARRPPPRARIRVRRSPRARAVRWSRPRGDSPPSSNDVDCRPTTAHPYPVVLVHGTMGSMAEWEKFSRALAAEGYCVFALNYGGAADSPVYGFGDVPTSAGHVAGFIDRVLGATGAPEVDLVGYSQGGVLVRYLVKNLGGASKVRELVALAAPNHGTTMSGLANLVSSIPGSADLVESMCAACTQQMVGSDFIQALNAGGETVEGVHYTVIASKYDQAVTPYGSSFLSGSSVTNVLLQDVCAQDFTDHLGIPKDGVALRQTLNALDPKNAKQHCTLVLPVFGG
ncbi:esterase/lipase family protein [Streptomyces sp. NPDC017254]